MAGRISATLLLAASAACGKGDQREVGLADTSQPTVQALPSDTAGSPVRAAETASKPEGEEKSAATVDREAIAALDKMGAYLRSLKAFQVKASTTRDEVLADGQKIEMASTADVLVRRPDRLRAEVTSDGQHRLFFYDGKSFTRQRPVQRQPEREPKPERQRQRQP